MLAGRLISTEPMTLKPILVWLQPPYFDAQHYRLGLEIVA